MYKTGLSCTWTMFPNTLTWCSKNTVLLPFIFKGTPLLAVWASCVSTNSLYSEKSFRLLVKVAEAPESPMNSISPFFRSACLTRSFATPIGSLLLLFLQLVQFASDCYCYYYFPSLFRFVYNFCYFHSGHFIICYCLLIQVYNLESEYSTP